MKKYRANSISNMITVVEAERETDATIWVSGRRESKRSSYIAYFDKWEEAHAYIMATALRKVEACQLRLKSAEKNYDITSKMTKPKIELECEHVQSTT